MSRHQTRPIPFKRLYTDWPNYPTRESDGEAHVGVMYDTRQLRIQQAREEAQKCLEQARTARVAGNDWAWDFCMVRAREWRKEYAKARQQ